MDQTAKQVYEATVQLVDKMVASGEISEYAGQEQKKSLFAAYSQATLAEAARLDRENEAAERAAAQFARSQEAQAAQAAEPARAAPVKVEEKPTGDRQAELEKLLAHPVVQSRDPEGYATWLERKNKLLNDEAER